MESGATQGNYASNPYRWGNCWDRVADRVAGTGELSLHEQSLGGRVPVTSGAIVLENCDTGEAMPVRDVGSPEV